MCVYMKKMAKYGYHDPIIVDGVKLVLIPIESIVTMHPESADDVEHDINLNGKFTE